ncbi:hypothetical protein KKB18_00950, partial [bacterium]|nr:hypothetical protein [bacterium]
MKKHHKLLLILLFAISLFVVAFVLFCYLGTPKIIRYVVSKGINTLEEKYDIKIVIEDIQFYGLNIRIKGSCIIKDTSYSINQINFNLLKQELELTDFMCIKNHFKFAQIEKASASLNILPLFKSTLEIKKIDIRNPKIYLELDSKDKLILPDYQIGNEYEQNKTSSKFKFLLPHIDISKGYLVLPSSVGINIEDIDIKAACDVSYEQQYFMIDLRKTKLRYGLQVFPLKSLNLEAYSEESKLTLKRFKLESIFANIDMTGDYNFNKDPSTMEINLNGDLSLQNIGNTFLSEGAFHGFAKFNAQIKGISSCPDISAWIKISDGYMKDIKVSDAYIPFQLINKGFEENIRNYQLQVLKGSLMISDIAKSWECNLPAIDIDLMLQYPFESSVGSINLKKPVFSINEYKYVNDSLLADLKFNRQGMEIPSAKIRYKKRVSSFNGKIFYDNDLRYSFSYDLKPDPEYTFKIKEDISIHGDFHIKGNIQGEKDKLKTEGSVVASEIYIIDEKITHTNFNYIVTDKSIDIEKIDIQLHEGNITGNFNFIPGLTPVYSGEFHLDSIDISCFNTLQINQYIPSGMLSGYLSFYSKDFEPENSKLDLNMKISEGGISDKKRYYPVDIKTDVDFDSGNLQIHQLYAKLFGMDAEVKGKSDMKGTLDLEYRFDSNNLDAIGRIFNLPIEKGFLSINGSAAGSWNLPTVDMNIRADSLKSDNLMVQHFAGTFKGEKGSYKLKDTEIILNNFKSKFSGNLEFPLQGGVIEYSNLSLHGDLKTEGIKNDNPLMDDLSISFIYTKDDLKFRLSSMDEKLGCIFTKNNIEGSFSSELKVRDFEIIEYLKGFVGSNKVGAINSIIISLDSNASGIMDKPKSVQGHGKIDKIIISNPYFVLTNKLPIIIDFTSLNFFIPDFEFFTNSSSISGMVRIDDYEKFI